MIEPQCLTCAALRAGFWLTDKEGRAPPHSIRHMAPQFALLPMSKSSGTPPCTYLSLRLRPASGTALRRYLRISLSGCRAASRATRPHVAPGGPTAPAAAAPGAPAAAAAAAGLVL